MPSYRRLRKVDVTYKSASTGSSALTSHINSRYDALVSGVGGPEYFEPVAMNIQFVNKLNQSHFKTNSDTQFELTQKLAKSSTTGSNQTYDWEAESSSSSSNIEYNDVNLDEMNIYMIIIEYTKVEEIPE